MDSLSSSPTRGRGRTYRFPLLALLIVVLALPAGASAQPAAIEGPTAAQAGGCVVPALKKKTLSQARKLLNKAGCRVGKVTRRRSSKVKKGRIISIRPAAKRRLKRNAKVAIVVSSGVKLCVVKRRDSKGKLRTVYERRYVYSGRGRRRKIVLKRFPLKAPCSKRCVRTRNGKTVYVKRKKLVTVKRRVRVGGRATKRFKLVRVRKTVRVPVLIKCPKASSEGEILGTPITITLREGSFATLDFGAFTRRANLTGQVKGFAPGRIDISKDTSFTITRGKINVAPTAVFIDDECFGEVTAAIRTGKDTHAEVNTSRTSTGSLVGGDITSVVYLRLKAPIELRNGEEGCFNPYITTGYTETELRIPLFGELETSGGFLGINLNSGTQLLDEFDACLEPGDPTRPCSGFSIPFPFLLRTRVVAELAFGTYTTIDTSTGEPAR